MTSNQCVHSPYAADNTLIVESHWSANTRIRCTVRGGCAYVSKKGAVEPETCDCHRAAAETAERRNATPLNPNQKFAAEIRDVARRLRVKPHSLQDLIPYLQRAADIIDRIPIDEECP